MPQFRDLNPVWFEQHPAYRDPPEPPEFWTEELRRMIDIDGVEIVLYRDQDGDEHVMDAAAYDRCEP